MTQHWRQLLQRQHWLSRRCSLYLCNHCRKRRNIHCMLISLPALVILNISVYNTCTCVVLWLLVLVLSSYTPPGRDLDSTFHYSHMLHCDVMEQALVADTGRIYLSSLQYCCMPPQLLHWPEWEDLHSQQYWLQKKRKILMQTSLT